MKGAAPIYALDLFIAASALSHSIDECRSALEGVAGPQSTDVR